jgi:hypothetical protein
MNILKKGLTAVILSVSLLYGAGSINEQIQAIQKASPRERAQLMNKLKIQIASMNEEERADAISSLRTEMGGKSMNQGTFPVCQRMQQIQSMRQENLMQRSGDATTTQFPRMRR